MLVEIYIATHKEYEFPQISGYIPIHVGKALSNKKLEIVTDNTGDQISAFNANFCELTALYWMWKNSKADIVGLVHYRRYFCNRNFEYGDLITPNDIQFSGDNNIIVAKPENFIKSTKNILGFKFHKFHTVKEQYCSCHYENDWDKLRLIISQQSPDYLHAFDQVANRTSGISFYNMFIANKKVADEYSEWLFSILFAFRDQENFEGYDDYQKRFYGFASERLLNVFLEKNQQKLKITYKPVLLIN